MRVYDQVSYNALALSLLRGDGFSFEQDWYPFTPANTPTAHWSFAYPLYLAAVYAVSGYHPLAARLVQAILSAAIATLLYYRLGRRLFGEKVGRLSAILAALYAYFVFYDAALMTESFFILGVLAMLILSLDIAEGERTGEEAEKTMSAGGIPAVKWLKLGAILGATALLRQTILLWVPILLGWLLWAGRDRARWKGVIACLGVAALFILPWTVRNYRIYEAFLPLNSNAGYALYSANHPAHGVNFDQDYAAPLPSDLLAQGLNEAGWNAALLKRGFEFIVEDPRRYVLLSLDRIGVYFNFWFSDESDSSSNVLRVLSFGLYLPFFVYGLVRSIRERPRARRAISLIVLFALFYSLLHVLTWASVRYRLPVDAALMPFAAFGLADLVERVRARSLKPAPQRVRNKSSAERHILPPALDE